MSYDRFEFFFGCWNEHCYSVVNIYNVQKMYLCLVPWVLLLWVDAQLIPSGNEIKRFVYLAELAAETFSALWGWMGHGLRLRLRLRLGFGLTNQECRNE
jgi:hypothetical protein